MRKAFCFFLVIIIFLGCSRTEEIGIVEKEIIALQKKTDGISLEKRFNNLKEAQKIIDQNPQISDSLKKLNYFFLGTNTKDRGKQDSAAVYFLKTTELVGDSIKKNSFDRAYFSNAFDSFKKIGKYGDCKTIIDSFKKKIDTTAFNEDASYYYYLLEEYYSHIGVYEKALLANKRRIVIIENWDGDKNPWQELLTQSNLLKNLNRKNEAEEILRHLISNDSLLTIELKRQIYTEYGISFFEQREYYKAILNYKKTLSNEKILIQNGEKISSTTSYSNIAEAYIKLKHFDLASKYLDSAKGENFTKLSEQEQRNILVYHLRLAYENNDPINNIEGELNHLFEYQNNNYKKKIKIELFELTKAAAKEKELLEENQKVVVSRLEFRNRMFFVLGSLLILILGIFYYSRNRKLTFEKHKLQMQQRLLRSQMNPHFTFNTLSSIQNTIGTKPKEAQKHIIKFSRLLRLILENSTNNYIQFNKEIEALQKYMDLQLLRFPSKFKYSFNYQNFEEDDLIFIPPMLLQPFIENSIEHGFANVDYQGEINVDFQIIDKLIYCKISDNGSGINAENTLEKESLSTKLISEYLKKETKKGVSIVDKRNISNESGLKVELSIPYKISDEN